ncbi:dTMP kinase [Buchnera aphidicola]|uniref:Thymidylate kinase n=1 Tax=Buchnera aphidicola subsp. Tuberolachnus salignus TaxID=98804 RepID=A0A160SWW4_BUCTT|nr:dTMP kinase [Buchnera aphidicola]CUR53210.1 Thymidylate kinase [Buchnera aphidicola (Tuberolachnus salignus)]
MKPGKFIVVEGIEGSGKTSSCLYIKKILYQFGIKKIISIREPGSTFLSEKIRQFIKFNTSKEPLNYKTMVLLLYASRFHLTEKIIYPALKKGIWVLSDRYEMSTYAYQGYNSQKKHNFIKNISFLLLKNFKPDLILYLDVTIKNSLKRILKRGKLDNIEKKNLSFFEKIRKEYLKQCKKEKNVIHINANLPQKIVYKNLQNSLFTWLQKIK